MFANLLGIFAKTLSNEAEKMMNEQKEQKEQNESGPSAYSYPVFHRQDQTDNMKEGEKAEKQEQEEENEANASGKENKEENTEGKKERTADEQELPSNYYQLFGCEKTADIKAIKKAYRKLAKRFHPDKNPPEKREEMHEKFKHIRTAYETLSDPNKRILYDLNENQNQYGNQNGSQNQNQNQNENEKGKEVEIEFARDVYFTLELTLEEAFVGCKKFIEFQTFRMCNKCKGTGLLNMKLYNAAKHDCMPCKGKGIVWQSSNSLFEINEKKQAICQMCSGSGKAFVPSEQCCISCEGRGGFQCGAFEDVIVDKGTRHRQMYTFKEKGGAFHKLKRGDLHVTIDIKGAKISSSIKEVAFPRRTFRPIGAAKKHKEHMLKFSKRHGWFFRPFQFSSAASSSYSSINPAVGTYSENKQANENGNENKNESKNESKNEEAAVFRPKYYFNTDDGIDISFILPISLPEALFGFTKQFCYLDGTIITFSSPTLEDAKKQQETLNLFHPGEKEASHFADCYYIKWLLHGATKNSANTFVPLHEGQILCLEGLGLFCQNGKRGQLFIAIHIEMPRPKDLYRLSIKQKRQLMELLGEKPIEETKTEESKQQFQQDEKQKELQDENAEKVFDMHEQWGVIHQSLKGTKMKERRKSVLDHKAARKQRTNMQKEECDRFYKNNQPPIRPNSQCAKPSNNFCSIQ